MSTLPDKKAVLRAVRERVEGALKIALEAAEDARRGATHEENRSEGDKDMRATEQSYVARGQAMRAEELSDASTRLSTLQLQTFDDEAPIQATALVRVRGEDDNEKLFFIVAWGAGVELDLDGTQVTVISPSSPMGRALLGKRSGDEVELVVKGTTRSFEIESVA